MPAAQPVLFLSHGSPMTALGGDELNRAWERLAPRLAKEQGCNPYPDGGFRIVVNTGAEGGQEVHHLHVHVMGGPRPWLKG